MRARCQPTPAFGSASTSCSGASRAAAWPRCSSPSSAGLEGFDRRVAVKRILPHLADSPDFVKMFLGEAQARRAALAPQRRPHLRVRKGRARLLHRDGVRRRRARRAAVQAQRARSGCRRRWSRASAPMPRPRCTTRTSCARRTASCTAWSTATCRRRTSWSVYDGVVKLCDFGIAKAAAVGDQLTNPGQVKGKYAYMSPGADDRRAARRPQRRVLARDRAVGAAHRQVHRAARRCGRGDARDPRRQARADRQGRAARAAAAREGDQVGAEPKRENRATAADFAQALEAFIKSSPELATPMQLGAWVRGSGSRARSPASTRRSRRRRGTPVAGTRRPGHRRSRRARWVR